MPEMTADERAARCCELRMRLNALDALEENERLFEEFRRTLEEAQTALEGSAEGAEGAVEDIGKAQEALDAFNDLLEGTSDFLEGASDALSEVSEGVEQFGETAGDIAGALEEINSTMQQVEDLQNLSEASAQDMINGLGEHLGGMVETLGPLVDAIPGMGAFLHMYGEAISGIAISVGKIEAEVAGRNQILQEAMGKDLYITPLTARQERAGEIEDILSRLDALDCYGAHGDGVETSGGSGFSTDFHAAVQVGLRNCNKTRTELEHAITGLNRSRDRLKRAWEELQALEGRHLSIGDEIDSWRASGDSNAQHVIDQLEQSRASLPERIESARERVQRALEDYDQNAALVDPCFQTMIAQAVYVPEADRAAFLEDLSQFDPNPDRLPIERIRAAVAPVEDRRTSLRPVLIGGGALAGAMLLTAAIVLPGGDPEPVPSTEAPAAQVTEQTDEPVEEELIEADEGPPQLDLADVALPEGLSYKITKTGDPIPAPFGEIPNGVQLEGTFDLHLECGPAGLRCAYAMGYEVDTPPHAPYQKPEVVPWEHNGTTWSIETPALFLSASYPGGFECVYTASDVWVLQVTDGQWDGSQWVAIEFTGTLVRNSHLDTEISAAGIAAGYCPPWAEATSWDVEATGRVAVP